MSNISEALAAIVKQKKKLGQTNQSKLAKMVGCTQGFISGMLGGDKPIKAVMLEKICAALEIKLSDLENWNPELAEIRFSQGSAEAAPPELIKGQTKLARLYKTNRPAFDGIAGRIDVWLKSAKADTEQPELEKEPNVDLRGI